MSIRILSIGKKHEAWVEQGIRTFLQRLRPPFSAEFSIIPHSSKHTPSEMIEDESGKLLGRIQPNDYVVLLDERGTNLSSPELSRTLVEQAGQPIVIIIGGAYGVTKEVRNRADLVWSLSKLVFPHQLVRLILAEQLYRAQEIYKGSQYHHN